MVVTYLKSIFKSLLISSCPSNWQKGFPCLFGLRGCGALLGCLCRRCRRCVCAWSSAWKATRSAGVKAEMSSRRISPAFCILFVPFLLKAFPLRFRHFLNDLLLHVFCLPQKTANGCSWLLLVPLFSSSVTMVFSLLPVFQGISR